MSLMILIDLPIDNRMVIFAIRLCHSVPGYAVIPAEKFHVQSTRDLAAAGKISHPFLL
jgi:hypothetical protein